ncbi:MAG: alpha/beta hydrolase [Rhodospirillales bacterium]|jgi:arylformamidase|nr:alpha/beta hydrolase [Rhodospirillales bacterium]
MSIDAHAEGLYNVRAAIPDHLEIFERWRKMSDDHKAACAAASLDMRYGPAPAEVLDFFPAKSPGGPLMMVIHGGYWQAKDKDENSFSARALNAAGVGVAVVNYTLCPDTTVREITGQMRRAALWLCDNAHDLGADSERFFVAGHSAGGHLSAMLMTEDWPTQDMIKGAVAVSGLFDLTALVNTTINDKVGLTPEEASALSPINHRPTSKSPMVLALGNDESVGFHDQAAALKKAWEPFGVPITILPLPGCHHLSAFEALADGDSALFRATLSLIE